MAPANCNIQKLILKLIELTLILTYGYHRGYMTVAMTLIVYNEITYSCQKVNYRYEALAF